MDLPLQGPCGFHTGLWWGVGWGRPLPQICAPHIHGVTGNPPTGVDTDELDSNVDDWEEETIEFFVTEEIIPLGNQE